MSLVIYAIAILVCVVAMLVLSYLAGERHSEAAATGEPYESGIPATGSARLRLAVPYYRVAVLFVIFDVEVAFLFAWAVALKQAGWAGYLGATFFVVVLAVGLVYEVRMGVLGTARPPGRKRTVPRPTEAHSRPEPLVSVERGEETLVEEGSREWRKAT